MEKENQELLDAFISSKKIEGCSERTLIYYGTTLDHFFSSVTDPVRKISTEQIISKIQTGEYKDDPYFENVEPLYDYNSDYEIKMIKSDLRPTEQVIVSSNSSIVLYAFSASRSFPLLAVANTSSIALFQIIVHPVLLLFVHCKWFLHYFYYLYHLL